MRVVLNIKDNTKASHLLNFLKDIPFVEIEESSNANATSQNGLMDLFGIWENSDIYHR